MTNHVSTGIGSGIIGADPDQLEALGSSLLRQQDDVLAVISTVTSVLSATAWTGPARQMFDDEWQNGFRSVLGRLADAFGAAGRDCVSRSAELRRVMGRF